ncbi:MAG: SWIM zinc finger domain-containing protein, partial [Bacteroidia bacterium]|nr:SWIM zinc finger domain-containing protein [Bacteroidia bacterium]
MYLSESEITKLAPDDGSAKAGLSLAKPSHWQSLGETEDLLWGEAKGSAIYRVQIDLSDFGNKCSCPSRKFPCKHVLGLLYLRQKEPQSFTQSDVPEWATTWIKARKEKAEQKTNKSATSTAKSEANKTKTADTRFKSVSEGLDELELWIQDLIRTGIASVEGKPYDFFEKMARRMIDAKASNLGRLIRGLHSLQFSESNWHNHFLKQIAFVQVLLDSFRRLDKLSPETQADIKYLIGWPQKEDELE